ncbi:hypothetical protein AGLY_002126 [Aphis glycines]|uniref:DUF4817 domain-containing protein n=1 Tax=Aphis glycines TaxID=307491 RepID=A0A6G0U4M8_APHGL|nr:hypothetical protein AGLY_002126 [Aphis glycines]
MLHCFIESGENSRTAARLYQQCYPDSQCPGHTMFYRINKQLSTNEDLNLSYYFIQKTAKKYKYHAYLSTRVQQLLPTDYERRITFVAHMMVRLEDQPNFLEKIMWTDEARFHNNGTVNHHNNHYWSDKNPHLLNKSNRQVRWGLNVWCGIMNDSLVGPYFFENNLNGTAYLIFLKNELPLLIEDISLDQRLNMIWQHDGAPAHNTLAVRTFLNDIFGDKWIGTQGSTILWPPRSPDMTVLDFYFWGYLKNEVYKEESNNLNDLKTRITEICNKIPASI